MLQPTSKLIQFFVILGIPSLTICSFPSPWFEIGVGIFFLLFLLLGVDAFRLLSSQPALAWKAPESLQGRVGEEIPLSIECQSSQSMELLIQPEFSEEIQILEPILKKKILSESKNIFSWKIKVLKRGTHSISHWHYALLSLWKFWKWKNVWNHTLRLSIYPNLNHEKRALAPFLLKRFWEGEQLLKQNGRGHEFDRLREYAVGDSLSDIHWKATARQSKLVSKSYRLEQNQEIYVILDSSRFSLRPSRSPQNTSQLDNAIDATLWLSKITQKSGDRFGVVTFSDQIHGFIRAGAGLRHEHRCRDILFGLQSRRVSPDFEELITFLRTRLRKRSLLLFLTSLDDPLQADLFQEHIRLLTRHHLVHVIMPNDPAATPLFSQHQTKSTEIDLHEKLAGHLLWLRMQELRKTLSHRGARLTLCDETQFSRSLIQRYLQMKRSQIL